MEDLIPLIIVILLSIIGAVTRKKKPQGQGEGFSAPGQRNSRDNDFLGWLEKLNVDEDVLPYAEVESLNETAKSEVAAAKIVTVNEPVKKEAAPNAFSKFSGFITPEERESLMAKEGISTVKKFSITEGDLTAQTNQFSETTDLKLKFEIDLRKAVIYNEILNPKYI